jgi:hypothetical protein
MQSKNYIIEGDADGITESDFFSQLKNMLSDGKNHDGKNTEDDCCLLTKEPLKNVHIVLACGHKFNYVPLYREVIAQKTIGASSAGYYTSHSLKRNEIKCPYCRNVQDKLLPYLQYDGVKRIHSINHPANMSMTSQLCTYSTNSASMVSNKGRKSAPCKECAIECHNGTFVCKKHYEMSLVSPISTSPLNITTDASSPTTTSSVCGAILRYGKNKGNPCSNPPSCRIHLAHSSPS